MPYRVDISLDDGVRLVQFYGLAEISRFQKSHKKRLCPNRPTVPILPWLIDMALYNTEPMLSGREVEKMIVNERVA